MSKKHKLRRYNFNQWWTWVFVNEGMADWDIEWNDSGDGLVWFPQKKITCARDWSLFLHEVAHAQGSPEENERMGDKTGHHALWADRFTELLRKYAIWKYEE